MSLKIKSWRKITKIAVGAVLGLLFLTFFVKVATFEDVYYREKEGSERAEPPAKVEEEVEEEILNETVPTEEDKTEYVVAPERPRYLTIEKLGIYKARVVPVTTNTSGEMGTPNNVFDVGWFDGSSLPGTGRTAIIDGHNGGPHVFGVFKELPSLVEGDIIEVERGDGEIFRYAVYDNEQISLKEANRYMGIAMRSPKTGVESLTLITCSGDWSLEQNTYLSRQFVRAVLVE